jgi:hypothetical protein
VVEIEQSAEPLGFDNCPAMGLSPLIGERDDIIETLVIAFVLMVSYSN